MTVDWCCSAACCHEALDEVYADLDYTLAASEDALHSTENPSSELQRRLRRSVDRAEEKVEREERRHKRCKRKRKAHASEDAQFE